MIQGLSTFAMKRGVVIAAFMAVSDLQSMT
jgi:hypothetical protein